MLDYHVFAVDCVPDINVQTDARTSRIRGYSLRTYTFFSHSDDVLPLLQELPYYEKPTKIRKFHTCFNRTFEDPQAIAQEFFVCTRCTLYRNRFMPVFHRGNPNARILFIGMGPGEEEDRTGFPFVGDSGHLLDRMLEKAEFKVPYMLTNLVCCRPGDGPDAPKRENPLPPEIVACSDRLWALISLLKPNAIICLGRDPAGAFWEKPKMYERNSLYRYGKGIVAAQLYHPAALLRKMTKGGMEEYNAAVDFLRMLSKMYEGKEVSENWEWPREDYPLVLHEALIKR